MENKLKETLLKICKLLEFHNVNYLLVGGVAVALNGYYRNSVNAEGELSEKPDIDIWFHPTYENYYRILNVIEALGLNTAEFKEEQSPNRDKSFFKLELDSFTLDLLPSIKADINFVMASKRKEVAYLEETKIYFLNYNDLILDKKITARKKDIEDIKHLKEIRRKNKNL